jgi:hypothetical protein
VASRNGATSGTDRTVTGGRKVDALGKREPSSRSEHIHQRRCAVAGARSFNGTAKQADFQQAKTAGGKSRFLQIVAKPDRKKRKERQQPKLTRVAFKVSRLMEFCTKRELQNQTGHSVDEWPLVMLKELMDNALDACEEAEVAPVLSITVKPGSVTIQDNGSGIKTSTVKAILDYTIRVSSREAYVSPTRGAQGMRLRPFLPWATCSIASAKTATIPRRRG